MIEEKIPVQIMGQTYEILGNVSEALYYNSLARFVEDKMKDIQLSTKIVSTQKVAVLAALNIADEVFRDRDNKQLSGKSQDKKFEELIHLLDRAMREPSEESPKPQATVDPVAEELTLTSSP